MTERVWELEIFERAEHWAFTATIKAATEAEARKKAAREYPKRDYIIRNVYLVNRGEGS